MKVRNKSANARVRRRSGLVYYEIESKMHSLPILCENEKNHDKRVKKDQFREPTKKIKKTQNITYYITYWRGK